MHLAYAESVVTVIIVCMGCARVRARKNKPAVGLSRVAASVPTYLLRPYTKLSQG